MGAAALLPCKTLSSCSSGIPAAASLLGEIHTLTARGAPPTTSVNDTPGTLRRCASTFSPTSRNCMPFICADDSVRVRMGTSSTLMGLTTGCIAPGGMRSRFCINWLYILTRLLSWSSPTLNWTVTTPKSLVA
ncbi:hypothetical protein GALL_549750 [mine drainage metagenome]|uniref:Uncharacterized protein n=1 Tax=mine drainage metagenome TaxID=410659 RepID=A0A1J5PE23_9ZZZZ